jgi:hypothetical protein
MVDARFKHRRKHFRKVFERRFAVKVSDSSRLTDPVSPETTDERTDTVDAGTQFWTPRDSSKMRVPSVFGMCVDRFEVFFAAEA